MLCLGHKHNPGSRRAYDLAKVSTAQAQKEATSYSKEYGTQAPLDLRGFPSHHCQSLHLAGNWLLDGLYVGLPSGRYCEAGQGSGKVLFSYRTPMIPIVSIFFRYPNITPIYTLPLYIYIFI